MTVVLDTTMVVAWYDRDDDHGPAAAAWGEHVDEDLVTSPLVVAEMDHLVTRHGGRHAQSVLWHDLRLGAYSVRWWATAMQETIDIATRHPFLGLADASLVALAGLLRTTRIATFDQHFRSVTTPSGEPFVLLPEDA